MKDMGFCVMQNGEKLVGICGLSRRHADLTKEKYAAKNPENTFTTHPVFIGGPMPTVVLPPIVLSKGGTV